MCLSCVWGHFLNGMSSGIFTPLACLGTKHQIQHNFAKVLYNSSRRRCATSLKCLEMHEFSKRGGTMEQCLTWPHSHPAHSPREAASGEARGASASSRTLLAPFVTQANRHGCFSSGNTYCSIATGSCRQQHRFMAQWHKSEECVSESVPIKHPCNHKNANWSAI